MSASFHCRPCSSAMGLPADHPLPHVGDGPLERPLRRPHAHGRVAAPLVVEVGQQQLERLARRRVAGHQHVVLGDRHPVEGDLRLGGGVDAHAPVTPGQGHPVAVHGDDHRPDPPGTLAARPPAPHQHARGGMAERRVVLVAVEPPPGPVGLERGAHAPAPPIRHRAR